MCSYPGGRQYPEVTGYLIPTLLSYGEKKLAKQYADWLVEIQNENGSFNDQDGNPTVFDTGAVMEGLRAIGYDENAARAENYLRGVIGNANQLYNLRVCGLLGIERKMELPDVYRMHYYAYALEGLYLLGHTRKVKSELKKYEGRNELLPYWSNSSGVDTCATAQIACLMMKSNLDASGLIAAVRSQVDNEGGVLEPYQARPLSWTAKYYLDMEKLHEG
jgi:hypothetical protein